MFKNMTVAARLASLFGTLCLGLVAVSAISLYQLSGLKQDMDLLAHDRVPKILLVKTATDNANVIARAIRNMLILENPATHAKETERIADTRKAVGESLEKLEGLITTDEGRELMAAVKEKRAANNAAIDQALSEIQAGRRLEAAAMLETTIRPAQQAYFAALNNLGDYQVQLIDAAAAEADANYETTFWELVILSAALIAAAGALAFLTIRSLTRQLGGEPGHAAEVARRIAAGDLTAAVATRPGDHESMLAAMRQMQAGLKETVAQLVDGADQVASTAAQLAASSSQVAAGSRQQSEAAAAMAASVEEMTVSVGHVADNAQEARAAADHSGELSQQGAAVIESAVREMGQIADTVAASARIIGELEQQSGQISAIVDVIKEIADQTNLLALNAAIEAARAGEQGRGFAVVADEVRKLAERTSASTQEIAAMIDKIQQGTHSAVASMENGVARANEGVALATRAGESITLIKTESGRTAHVVTDISNALKEQRQATTEIAQNVERIAQMTEENSAAVQQSASAAEHLEQLAASLQSVSSRFRV